MKVNSVQSIISVSISALLAYGLFAFNESENNLLLGSGSFICLSLTSLWAIGISFDLPRTTTVVRTISSIFFMVVLASNLIFFFLHFKTPFYIIVNGLITLLYILIIYVVAKQKQ